LRHRWVWPLAILAGALALRLVLFTGIQGGDDAYYYDAALRVMKGQPLGAWNLLHTRVGYLLPMGALFSLFGPTTACMIVPSLAASLSLVAMAWWLGRDLFSEEVGRIAAGVVALFPIDVFLATTATTDVPMAFWIGLGVCLARSAVSGPTTRGTLARSVLAALCFGLAWVTRETAPLFILPTLPLLVRRPFRREAIAAGATLAAIGIVYLVSYAVVRGDPLHPMRVARGALEGQEMPQEGLLRRLVTLPSFCFNPLDAFFPYTGGLAALTGAGCIHALVRDRSRLGGVACWWLASAMILILYPLSIFPYRPAVFLVPRLYAMLTLPGALLAAVFLKEVLAPKIPRITIAVGAAVGLLAIACATRIHADTAAWRVGPEWAYGRLRGMPGTDVLTDPKTATLLQILWADAPPHRLRTPRKGDGAPPPGTILLLCSRQAAASRKWNDFNPPEWWEGPTPPRETVAEQRVPGPRSLRGKPGPEEHTVLRRIVGYSPR
jgi:hypothetical protein